MSATPYSTIYAFGDSLSDAGNVSVASGLFTNIPVSPPYYHTNYGAFRVSASVFSNGPVWVQDLSVALGLGTLEPSLVGGNDFAYGGAQTGSTPQSANNPMGFLPLLDLPAQLDQFEIQNRRPSASALYTLSIGGNDVTSILSAGQLTAEQQATDITASINNEVSFVHSLAQDGANNVLVMNVPDLGAVPEESGNAALATLLSAEYNAQLATALASEAAMDGINLHILDAQALIDRGVADPSAYGFDNVTTPVWSGNYTSSSSGTLATTDLTEQNQYLFWDHIHPTENGQSLLASAAAAQVVPPELVDAPWYDFHNPDVAASGISASDHYAQYGWHEGRDPNAYFSTVGYLAANPDVRAAGLDPLTHFDEYGWKEGRDSSANFDTRLYLLHNPDVAKAGLDPLQHYLTYGQFEGRANEQAIGPAAEIAADHGFDPEFYLLSNPDVARAALGYSDSLAFAYYHY